MKSKSNSKERVLGILSTFELDGRYLIALEKQWINFFICENPEFEAVIDKDGRYTLRGPMVHLNPHKSNPTAEQEDTIHE